MPEEPAHWGVEGVSVLLSGRLVLDDVSFPASPGAVGAVVGGDGAGKTTLLRTITGRVEPDAGKISVPARERIGFQPAGSGTWANLTVDENLALVARAYGLDSERLRRHRDELLAAADLLDARGRLASQLSGGMRQKLGFCMAILHEPELLVLDEPSTGVDPVSRVELWALIADAAAKGAAVVMATTYLDEAERTQYTAVLEGGVVLMQGTPGQVLSEAPGTVSQVTVSSDPSRSWRRGREIHQWHPGPPNPGDDVLSVDMEDAVVAGALDRRGDGGSPMAFPAPPLRGDDEVLVRAIGLTKEYGSLRAVDDVSMDVSPGEIVGLIGANGAGKTTLIRMLLGILGISGGEALLFGSPPSRRARRRVGYVPQGLGLYRDLTVTENLSFVASAYQAVAELQGDLGPVAAELVAAVGLGRQRELAFACALSHAPSVLILDEPTSGVDPISRARLWDAMHAQAEAGAGLLVSTHYMEEAEQCDRLVLMDLGRVVAQGTIAEIVGATKVIGVRTGDWASAFRSLRAAGLPVALAGRQVRVVDTSPRVVEQVLQVAGLSVQLEVVPATLEEKMTAITRARSVVSPRRRP